MLCGLADDLGRYQPGMSEEVGGGAEGGDDESDADAAEEQMNLEV